MSRLVCWLGAVSVIATLSAVGLACAAERPYYALPAAAVASGVGPETTVNYEAARATLGEVLIEVTRQTGVQVMAASPYLDTAVAVRICGQPLRVVLEDLARLLRCKWRIGGGVLLLSPLSAVALPEPEAPEGAFYPVLKELISSLTAEQRTALDAGGAVVFAALLPEQQVTLKALVAYSEARRPPQYYSDGTLVEYPEQGWKIIEYLAENDVWELSVRYTAPPDPVTGHTYEMTSHFTYRGPLAPKLQPTPADLEKLKEEATS
mgnify:CR=1 FL=1